MNPFQEAIVFQTLLALLLWVGAFWLGYITEKSFGVGFLMTVMSLLLFGAVGVVSVVWGLSGDPDQPLTVYLLVCGLMPGLFIGAVTPRFYLLGYGMAKGERPQEGI